MMDVKNVIVVVSRWWGGILLGPGILSVGRVTHRSIQAHQQCDAKCAGEVRVRRLRTHEKEEEVAFSCLLKTDHSRLLC